MGDAIHTNKEIIQSDIRELNKDLLAVLLLDRTTHKNILWGTMDYSDEGSDYAAGDEIKVSLITGKNEGLIRPRILKAVEQKEGRTRERAEVFTPSWICNQQNNLIDDQWFGREGVFNSVSGTSWTATTDKIMFDEKGFKTWKGYVDAKRLEITCGEAPYLVSRYDTVTGHIIPIPERVGLLDRKLRVVNENTTTKEEWIRWARRAVESIYGYEYQGDSLLIARNNVLFTYTEYYSDRFGEAPNLNELKGIALVVSWNLWQMDGFNYAVPKCEVKTEPTQISLFDLYPDMGDFDYNALADPKGQALCKIRDWRSKATIIYKDIVDQKTESKPMKGGKKNE